MERAQPVLYYPRRATSRPRYAGATALHLPNLPLAAAAPAAGVGVGAACAPTAHAPTLLAQPGLADAGAAWPDPCAGRGTARPSGQRGDDDLLARRLRLGLALAARPRRNLH